MKVAYYSPQPPERSGIADYSALLLPALAKRIDVDVVRRGSRRVRRRVDVSLYHVGNDPAAHGWIVEALRRRPGIVVLHERLNWRVLAGAACIICGLGLIVLRKRHKSVSRKPDEADVLPNP